MNKENYTISFDQLQYAVLPYILSATPESAFWNRMMSFFDENNIEDYRFEKVLPKAGVNVYKFQIRKNKEIDQCKLANAVYEYFGKKDTFPNFLYLYASMVYADGTTEITAAIDPDVDLADEGDDFYSPADEGPYDSASPAESFFLQRMTALLEKNNISDYELKTFAHGNGVNLFRFEINEKASVCTELLKAAHLLFHGASILKTVVLVHVFHTYSDGTIAIEALVDSNADTTFGNGFGFWE